MSESIYGTDLHKEKIYDLICLAQSGDDHAKETIISQNIGLVKNIVSKFMNSGYEWDDLLQIGSIGLLKAIERFDPSYNVMFSTYAVPLILGEIKRFIRDDGKIKLTRTTKYGIKKLRNAQDSFYNSCGRSPKISELSNELGMDYEEIMFLMEADNVVNSIESIDDPDNNEVYNKQMHVSEEEKNINLITLKNLIGKLKDKERQIVVLRYFKDMTQQEIADLLGISQVQVSRIEKRLLDRLKNELATEK